MTPMCEICVDTLSDIQCTRCVYRWCKTCDQKLQRCPYCRLQRKRRRSTQRSHFIYELFDEVYEPDHNIILTLLYRLKILFLFIYFFQLCLVHILTDIAQTYIRTLSEWLTESR